MVQSSSVSARIGGTGVLAGALRESCAGIIAGETGDSGMFVFWVLTSKSISSSEGLLKTSFTAL